MDAARLERIQDLFHRATDVPAEQRDAFIDAEAGDDADLASHVRRMLKADAARGSLLDRPLGDVAERVLTDDIMTGRMFGPYRVEELIGEGGMGVVYLAERSDLHSRAAIKVLRDAWISPRRRERFATEQRMLAKLNHPGIAHLYDAGTLADGTPWIAMEYVRGLSLTEYCRQQRCTLRERLRLFRDVCEAVGHAHRHLIVHRDLKPSNIMVTTEGQVKLLDFGIAKQLEPEMAADQSRGVRPMTPGYAAPEQLRGEPIGVHTDVYTLGVVLYELLTARLPFDLSETTPESAALLISTQAPEQPSIAARAIAGAVTARAGEWADLDVLCLNALRADAERRYRTIDALIRDVDNFLDGQPLQARPDSARYRMGKFIGRHRASLSATAAVVALFIGLASFYTIRLARARDAALASAARADRVQKFTMDLFNGGDENQGPADSVRVVTLLDRGLEQTRQLSNEPVAQADMLLTLGKAFKNLGRFDRADSLMQIAFERRRTTLGSDNPDLTATFIALAELREAQGKAAESEKYARDALALVKRVRPPGHPDIPVAMSAVGRALVARQQYVPAIAVLEDALKLQQAEPGEKSRDAKRDVAVTMQVLANAYFYAGKFSEADSMHRRVLAIDRTIYGSDHPEIGTDLVNIGNIQFQRGNYVVAESAYRNGEAIYEAWFGKDNAETSMVMVLLAQSLMKESRPEEAQPLLEQALKVQMSAHPGAHPRVAYVLNSLALTAAARNRHRDAEQYFRRAADMYRTLSGADDPMLGTTLSNLAATVIEEHDYPRAERLEREALAIFAKTLPPEHPVVAQARARLGRTLVRESRWSDAEPVLLSAYEIANKNSMKGGWVGDVKADLAATYSALGRVDEARKYRDPPSAPH